MLRWRLNLPLEIGHFSFDGGVRAVGLCLVGASSAAMAIGLIEIGLGC